jgi:hypothetical protein
LFSKLSAKKFREIIAEFRENLGLLCKWPTWAEKKIGIISPNPPKRGKYQTKYPRKSSICKIFEIS